MHVYASVLQPPHSAVLDSENRHQQGSTHLQIHKPYDPGPGTLSAATATVQPGTPLSGFATCIKEEPTDDKGGKDDDATRTNNVDSAEHADHVMRKEQQREKNSRKREEDKNRKKQNTSFQQINSTKT